VENSKAKALGDFLGWRETERENLQEGTNVRRQGTIHLPAIFPDPIDSQIPTDRDPYLTGPIIAKSSA